MQKQTPTIAHLFRPLILSISTLLYRARPFATSTSSHSSLSLSANPRPILVKDAVPNLSAKAVIAGLGGTLRLNGSREAIDDERDMEGWS